MTNNSTDTPRTDLKALELREVQYPHDFYALGDLCRELERELKDANIRVNASALRIISLNQQLTESKAEVERLKGIVKAQQDELEAISCALGTNEGHSSVDHIVTLRAEVEELQQQKRNCMEIIDDDAKEKAELKAEVERLRSILRIFPSRRVSH